MSGVRSASGLCALFLCVLACGADPAPKPTTAPGAVPPGTTPWDALFGELTTAARIPQWQPDKPLTDQLLQLKQRLDARVKATPGAKSGPGGSWSMSLSRESLMPTLATLTPKGVLPGTVGGMRMPDEWDLPGLRNWALQQALGGNSTKSALGRYSGYLTAMAGPGPKDRRQAYGDIALSLAGPSLPPILRRALEGYRGSSTSVGSALPGEAKATATGEMNTRLGGIGGGGATGTLIRASADRLIGKRRGTFTVKALAGDFASGIDLRQLTHSKSEGFLFTVGDSLLRSYIARALDTGATTAATGSGSDMLFGAIRDTLAAHPLAVSRGSARLTISPGQLSDIRQVGQQGIRAFDPEVRVTFTR